MDKVKNKILSLRVDGTIYKFVEDFSKKINLSKSETLIYMLKRSIGIFKYENNEKCNDNSILNKVLNVIDNNKEVDDLDKKILITVYRLLDLDIIEGFEMNDMIVQELSLNLINKLTNENLTADDFMEHIKKMDSLIEHFSPYFLTEVNHYVKHRILTKEKNEDTLFTLGINYGVIRFLNNK